MGSSASEPEASGYLKTQNLRFYREKIEGLEFRRKLRVRLCNTRRPIDHDALETKANERMPYGVTASTRDWTCRWSGCRSTALAKTGTPS
ncbi:hypothetical protein [Rhodococcus sp. NCIMB 12038]|uniref:hypothetical protein n=1 Tax=Rhodococcus sp. NCIMB 12038 TaxID=933800 RepID=UPI00211B107C|nr:hypothetical protein [Rhodococcus sp. NCIMB 12038]